MPTLPLYHRSRDHTQLHSYSTPRKFVHRIDCDERGAEMHAAYVIKSKVADAHADAQIELSTGGRKLFLNSSLSSSSSNSAFFDSAIPATEMSLFQQTLSLSRKQTRTAAKFFRKWKGRKAVEAGLESKLQQIDKTLSNFFCYH